MTIFDIDNLGMMNLPFKTLKVVMETLQSQYKCTGAKVFVLRVTGGFSFVYSTIKGFIPEHTKRKI